MWREVNVKCDFTRYNLVIIALRHRPFPHRRWLWRRRIMKRHGYVANAEVKTSSLVRVAAKEGQWIFCAIVYIDA